MSSYSKPIESIHIEKFRGLQDVKLEGLGQINLLVGVNNSGKTSVLEAVATYCSPLSLREWINIARQRDQEGKLLYRVSPLDALIWLFPHYSGLDNNELYKGEICMAAEGSFYVKRLLATCEVIEGIKSPTIAQINDKNDLNDGDINDILEEDNETDEVQSGIRLLIFIDQQYPLFDNNGKISMPGAVPEEFLLWSNERITYKANRKDEQIVNQIITPFSHRIDPYPTKLFTQTSIAGFKQEVIKLLQLLDPDIEDLEILTSSGITFREVPILYIK